jgi:ribosome biogenesis GTPase
MPPAPPSEPGPTLAALGWSEWFAERAAALLAESPALRPARVSVEHRGQFEVTGPRGTRRVWAPQGSQYDIESPEIALARPRVGDWVLVDWDDEEARIVHRLPRRTALLRRLPRRKVGVQVVAANLDRVLVVTSVDADFNLRRIERYLTAVQASGAAPVVVVNKIDRESPGRLARLQRKLAPVAPVPVLLISAHTGAGLDGLSALTGPGQTLGLVGSSGVGKSSLVNALLGFERQEIGAVRPSDTKGRHTTTHRELVVLPGSPGPAGVLLDTPGMRELQLWEEGGVSEVFDDLEALAKRCRWRSCTHRKEDGCAIQAAVEAGEVERARVQSWRKLRDEGVATREARKRARTRGRSS